MMKSSLDISDGRITLNLVLKRCCSTLVVLFMSIDLEKSSLYEEKYNVFKYNSSVFFIFVLYITVTCVAFQTFT